MAPAELKELKEQLQDLLDKGLVSPMLPLKVHRYCLLMSTPAENLLFFFFFIFLDTDPHLASVCVISISFPFRDMSCVCVGTCVRVCV